MNDNPETLLVGLARVDITPPVGAILAGYGDRPSTSVDLPLYAEAMVCRQGAAAWALVTCDLIGLAAGLVTQIRQAVGAACPVPPAAVMVSVTHTHSGPDTIARDPDALAQADRDYRGELVAKIRDLVAAAWRAAGPASLHWAETEVPGFAHNRRVPGADGGEWANEWWDPQGRHTGPVDNRLTLLAIKGPDNRLRGLLVNFACHPVTLGPQSLAISPDYAGHLKEALAGRAGIGQVAFCLAGAADLNPRRCILADPEEARRMGSALADRILPLLDRLQPLPSAPPVVRQLPWEIRVTRPRPANKHMDDGNSTIRTGFQVLACGGLAIFAVPGELFCELNASIRGTSGFPCTLIASISNDYIGYLPTDKAVREGGYEVRMAPADGMEAAITAAARRLLQAP